MAEVPVSDVLCDAMEYLCKLGSNLRIRSQNLKDKRISKEKLRNTHAVRKAASKVLLICELSRKSLENVENGVKRVLTLVDASSRFSPVTVGAKNENHSKNKKNCFYFEYDDCRLRISEKILLKHYTSVKVHAKSMPESMMEKYPVYYNCSLYRKRKKTLKESFNNKCQETRNKEDNELVQNVNVSNKSDLGTASSDDENKKNVNTKKKVIKDKMSSEESDDNNTKEKEIGDKAKKIQAGSSKANKRRDSEDTAATQSDESCKDTNKESTDSEKQSKIKSKAEMDEEPKGSESDDGSTDLKKKEINKAKCNKKDNQTVNSSDDEEMCNKPKKANKKKSDSSQEESNDDNKKENSQKQSKIKSRAEKDEEPKGSESDDGSIDLKKKEINKAKCNKKDNKIVNSSDDEDMSCKDTNKEGTDSEKQSRIKSIAETDEEPKGSESDDGSVDLKKKEINKAKCNKKDNKTVNSSDDEEICNKPENAKIYISDSSQEESNHDNEKENSQKQSRIKSIAETDEEPKGSESDDGSVDLKKKEINKAKCNKKDNKTVNSSDDEEICNKPENAKIYISDSSQEASNHDNVKENSQKQSKIKSRVETDEEPKGSGSDDGSIDLKKKVINKAKCNKKDNKTVHSSDDEEICNKPKNAKKNISDSSQEESNDDNEKENSQKQSKIKSRAETDEEPKGSGSDDGSINLKKKVIHKAKCNKKDNKTVHSSDDEEICNKPKNAKKNISDSSEEESNVDNKKENRKIKQDDSSVGSEDDKPKPVIKQDSKSKSHRTSSIESESEGKKVCSEKSKKSKSVKFVDSDSDQKSDGNERKKRKLDTEIQEKKSMTDESEIINLIEDSPIKPKKDLKPAEVEDDSHSSSSGKKPMIKLVSLNKLLKPDVLQKEISKENKNDKSSKPSPVTKTYKNNRKKSDTQDEEMKRAVRAFKAKKFDVAVSRLPKFTDLFLCKYGLKRITQNGSEIYTLTLLKHKENKKSSLKTDENNSKSESKEKSCAPTDATNKKKIDEGSEASKNALLNSDSEDIDANKEVQKNHKKSKIKSKSELSDSEKDEGSDKKDSNSDSPSEKTKSKSPDKNGKAIEECKEKLVANSDPDNIICLDTPKTPERKKEGTDKTTPQSKRKLMMESMRAKKMLLTYSSSSDTEDDQLRNALKEIKNSLLKGSSSSDDELDVKKMVQMNRRKLVTPSDSDDSSNMKKKERAKDLADGKEQEDSSISQMDGTNDELSNSSCSQMGRSKTKPSSSSSEKVDPVDSEINRLSNLKTLNRPRRRSVERTTRSTRRMPKAPPIKEEMLAPVSSGSSMESDHDAAETEELPPIAIPKLNGDSINHIAKEDLLAQSESSSSDNDKANGSEDDKKDSESDEDTVKSRRRKPNAIASDSEAEAARKANKMSDFEDSEAESSEPRKKSKRKKKGSDSDGSVSSTDGGKKKRRRIKQVNDSDGSGSDTENEGRKHGRKNIRKVMSKDQLEEATKKAARQEKERIARIAERQKLYNNLEFDETGKPDEVVLDKVVLDFNPETKEPIIEVDRGLVKKLKPHQANGIKFMWNACFESVKRIKKDRGSGCILAHCMGLGKTLQVVSLTHTLLRHSKLTGVERVLVVCPLSTVLNWVNEFTMWLKHAETDSEVEVFELSRHKQNSERSWQLQQWVECGGVCVLGYEMFRNLSADNNKKFKKKMLKTFQEALVDPGPDLVVCDEGHLLKNEKTSLSQSMNRVRTLRRIVLTGTPLQNNLKEYYCMVQFVKPNLLGKYNEYLNRFVNPITNGQYTDSTERDISIMKRRSHVLHTMLDGAVQRRDYGVLAPFLPPKHEYVLFITLTDIQVKLYQHYLDNYSRRPLPGKSSGFLFPDFQSLQRIWTHPLVLKYNSERYEIMQQKKRDKEEEDSEGSLVDFIDDDSTPEESSTDESSDDMSGLSDDSQKKSKKKAKAKKGKAKDSKASGRRNTRANPVEILEEEKPNSDIEEVKYENPTEWWIKLVTEEELEDIRHSHKLQLLFEILRQCEAIGDKLLVFSQSLYSLDLIEHFLGKVDEATQEGRIDEKLASHVGSWSPGVDYFRLDGSTSCENRSIWCKNFNREDNPRARLFLISTRAGGLGINLVAANRVVIFDVSWNPSHDVQSIFRVYRFGQKKPCYIYRFLAMGTMEEKIYERQVTKQAISKRVIDEQQIDRHYAANDLAELYKFEPVPAEPRPVPKLPKDRLFAEMIKDREKQIFKFHEHDSLLENKEEETLSEEERKKAWEEFENEKKAPPPSPFPNTWAMQNGMASLLQQQQQQLAYAALAAMIRKDMPNINENQIRDMLPIICNANPGMFGGYDYGLMQKMSEIYKYAPPGMMNPSMMNPVMNPAGGGMSTSSSLQYEPPWQRQQQQQQQMRLQQLMQQQQSMGAKYYAGGLGSRDPVAMAMQQQRAREFLLSGGGGGGAAAGGAGAGAGAAGAGAAAPPAAGRPRGRPPLQPRAPQQGDVVNLADSD